MANTGNSVFIDINKNLSIIKNKTIIEQNKYNNSEKKRIKIARGIKYGKEKEKEKKIKKRRIFIYKSFWQL